MDFTVNKWINKTHAVSGRSFFKNKAVNKTGQRIHQGRRDRDREGVRK